jgi:RNA polymerase sigma-54 factor
MLRTPEARAAAPPIVESVEDDGYLREDDEVLAARFHLEPRVVAEVRAALQRCEPTGIGARNLAECLALQLKEKDRFDPAMAALIANLPLLARADFAELMRRCGVDAEDLQEMIGEIKRLDPKPGLGFAPDEPPTVVPDLFIHALGAGRWRVELNSGTLPRVLVDSDYHTELTRQPLDRPAKDYLTERLQSANWLAKALDQRARTVLRVAKAIFARQMPFLDGGAHHLRPLVLRDIAEATGLHESTVSRATSDKYAATPHGTFPLKYFFTTAIAATSGDQSHSAEAIRQQIKRMIERESPSEVLSDDQIVAELKGKGVVIARRTVAKYRESLGIASSVERRRAKALGR